MTLDKDKIAVQSKLAWRFFKRYGLLFFYRLFALGGILLVRMYFSEKLAKWGIPPQLPKALLVWISGQLILDAVRLLTVRLYLRRIGRENRADKGEEKTFMLGVDRIAFVLSVFVVFLALLTVLGMNFREFLTSVSIVAAALAILFKDYITNMLNGMIIIFSDQASLHDYVRLNDQEGLVTNFTLLNIELTTDTGEMVYVPNSAIYALPMTNYSRLHPGTAVVEAELPAAAAARLPELQNLLAQHLAENGLPPESVQQLNIGVTALMLHGIRIKLLLPCPADEGETERRARKLIRHWVAVWQAQHGW